MDVSNRRLFAYCLLAAVVGLASTVVAGVDLSGAGGAVPFVAAVVVLAVLLFLDGRRS